jgi:hypothetical protein
MELAMKLDFSGRHTFRYTSENVNKIIATLLLILATANFGHADGTSFRRVKIPHLKGREINAALTFSDTDKAVQVRPVKGEGVNIPYREIERCSYQFTRKHRINDFTIVTAPLVVGAVVMITKGKVHWLEIDYRERDVPKVFVLHMDKHNYIRILEALKAHAGIDAEILGNAEKRR